MTTAVETPTVKVGDYFYRSWGYDQTNVNYYMVVGLTPSGKSAKLVEVQKGCVKDDGPQVYVSPLPIPLLEDRKRIDCPECGTPDDPYRTSQQARYDRKTETWTCFSCRSVLDLPKPEPEVFTKRIKVYGNTVCTAFNSYSSLFLWDCKPKYQTGVGWGH